MTRTHNALGAIAAVLLTVAAGAAHAATLNFAPAAHGWIAAAR